jgi:hypothetical protein
MANVKAKYAVSIDLTTIDKSRIMRVDKNGNPYKYKEGYEAKDAQGNILCDKNGNPLGPQYYSFDVVIFDEPNKIGKDVLLSEGQTQEERQNQVKSKAIGNGKTIYTANTPPPPPQPSGGLHPSMQTPPSATPPIPDMGGDDSESLPF